MKWVVIVVMALVVSMEALAQNTAGKTLDIYFIDVEGGQATLLVTPQGETLLIDTGFPAGAFATSAPGIVVTSHASQIAAAALDASVKQIDYLQQDRSIQGVWQLHRAEASGTANFADERIANLDASTAHYIKLSAKDDGSFRVFNARTGKWAEYGPR